MIGGFDLFFRKVKIDVSTAMVGLAAFVKKGEGIIEADQVVFQIVVIPGTLNDQDVVVRRADFPLTVLKKNSELDVVGGAGVVAGDSINSAVNAADAPALDKNRPVTGEIFFVAPDRAVFIGVARVL